MSREFVSVNNTVIKNLKKNYTGIGRPTPTIYQMKHFLITCDRPIGSGCKVLLSPVYLLKFLVNELLFKVWKIQMTIET